MLNSRKLWSAHLHSLGPALRALISDLAAQHSLPGLGPLLRRVCAQLVSLSPPTASLVVSAVLASCHSCLQAKAAAVAARLMAFLAWLVGQPTVKSVVIALFQEEDARNGRPPLTHCATLSFSIEKLVVKNLQKWAPFRCSRFSIRPFVRFSIP